MPWKNYSFMINLGLARRIVPVNEPRFSSWHNPPNSVYCKNVMVCEIQTTGHQK